MHPKDLLGLLAMISVVVVVSWGRFSSIPTETNVATIDCPSAMELPVGSMCESKGVQAGSGSLIQLGGWKYAQATFFGGAALRQADNIQIKDTAGKVTGSDRLLNGVYTIQIGKGEARLGIDDPITTDPKEVSVQLTLFRPTAPAP
ncbi:hypothetical protein HGA91_01490 [candidate division WWE3 bacterium]|nr:hypothetical protein [candidate division WWE3 bacterium]